MGAKRSPLRPVSLFVLSAVLLVEGVAALVGGVQLLRDPYGAPLGMPLSFLAGSPFASYLIPGLLLTLVLGVFPLVALALLWWRPEWPAMAWLERLTRRHWTWSLGVAAGVAMMVWIAVQVAMLGASHPLQAFIAGLGLMVVLLAFVPEVTRAYPATRRVAPHAVPSAAPSPARRPARSPTRRRR